MMERSPSERQGQRYRCLFKRSTAEKLDKKEERGGQKRKEEEEETEKVTLV
jgi:hypothetical protein